MFIEIVEITVENKGKYKAMTVAYRKDGTLAEKKLMSFGGSAPSFNALLNAKKGDTFEVVPQKNDKDFWDWVSATPSSASSGASKASNSTPSPRSSYETPEERARRQILIVRQSSVSSAVALLAAHKKESGPEEVIQVARQFENYVMGKNDVLNEDAVTEISDDLPF